ncbi:2,5-didehydrogluconate reductase [Reticulomyxa filosa]|uniref:2,5-didehydrogluconate reductase n=1 Tax=Reticulomyxa filosa TaxID=46433 RepID=X6LXC8_RETFI|nr:2,5-didehydrogluconate reductase [Reticulomyxa filosa]|eukprot:ETO06279.1 2,5-didehydrogluconate reductase [Reticulomyxa filosa]
MTSLGTGALRSKQENDLVIKEAVSNFGYGAIDSAASHESESSIGALLAADKSLRSRLFLSSKIWSTKLSFQESLKSVHNSLASMKTNYIDLYITNWPACFDLNVECSKTKDTKWEQSYEALLKLYGEGLVLNIGVSNADEDLVDVLLTEFSVKPQILHSIVDLNDLNWDYYDFLHEQQIILQAYGTYRRFVEGKGLKQAEIKKNVESIINDIQVNEGVQVSPSQLILRFLVENSIAVVPRTSKSLEAKENNNLFEFVWTSNYNVRLGGRPDEKTEL